MSQVDANTIKNEVRAITTLCESLTHENIVTVFRHGYLQDNGYFFYDMELCNMNLKTYIWRMWKEPVPQEIQHLTRPLGPREKVKTALYIMLDITEGVSFIHSHGEIHRDLKPENGVFLSITLLI